jgi:hypothetical protein
MQAWVEATTGCWARCLKAISSGTRTPPREDTVAVKAPVNEALDASLAVAGQRDPVPMAVLRAMLAARKAEGVRLQHQLRRLDAQQKVAAVQSGYQQLRADMRVVEAAILRQGQEAGPEGAGTDPKRLADMFARLEALQDERAVAERAVTDAQAAQAQCLQFQTEVYLTAEALDDPPRVARLGRDTRARCVRRLSSMLLVIRSMLQSSARAIFDCVPCCSG